MLAFHGIFSAYGFWLPNDPRGSWSDWVASWEIFRYGPTSTVHTTRSLAKKMHDQALRLAAKEALKYPPVTFTGLQARAIANGFAVACQASGYRALACAILPDHVHMVIEAHHQRPRQIIGHLKGRATTRLLEEGLHPFAEHVDEQGNAPMCWARQGWNVFLDTPEEVARSIEYVEQNPIKEGLRDQRWRFVQRSIIV